MDLEKINGSYKKTIKRVEGRIWKRFWLKEFILFFKHFQTFWIHCVQNLMVYFLGAIIEHCYKYLIKKQENGMKM